MPDTTVVDLWSLLLTFGLLVCSRTALSPMVDIRDLSLVTATPYCLFSHAKGEGRQKRGTTKSTVLEEENASTENDCRSVSCVHCSAVGVETTKLPTPSRAGREFTTCGTSRS